MYASSNSVSNDINHIFSVYRNYEQLVNASDVSIFNHLLFIRLAGHFLNHVKIIKMTMLVAYLSF